ncbi:MAG: adenine deaminase [Desulfurispora sp.]|uniref:adenine deaminase n=1 Tax=Desulfurispora sp. TaxID=3014275 RepID=UPI004049D903
MRSDRNVQQMQEIIRQAAGRQEIDLCLKNARLVNVLSGEIHRANIGIHQGQFVGFGDYAARECLDLAGAYVCPGLIDAHVHIESTMLVPERFAGVVMPRGTTAVIADPHEIANVCGVAGIRYMLEAAARTPLRIFYMLPSCVPASPLETAGAQLTARDLAQFWDHPQVIGLAEVMDYPAVLAGQESVLDKIAAAGGRPVDGHAPGLQGRLLSAYIAAGIGSDHECSRPEEMREKLRCGMRVMLRQGSAARNLLDLLPAVNSHNSRRCIWATDDRNLLDIVAEGHVDQLIRLACQNGLDLITAVQMATINTAEWFGLKGLGAIAPGYAADFIIFEEIDHFCPREVYIGGQPVARAKKSLVEPVLADTAALRSRVILNLPEAELQRRLEVPDAGGPVPVIGVSPGQIITEKLHLELPVQDGLLAADPQQDVAKLAVLERHHGQNSLGVGFVRGLGLKRGAIAATVAHDAHNLIVAGMNDRDMLQCIFTLARAGGGLCAVAGGELLGLVELPVAGLMSDWPVDRFHQLLLNLHRSLSRLGLAGKQDPFMMLSFLALPVIPALRLTDRGLIDVREQKIIKLP